LIESDSFFPNHKNQLYLLAGRGDGVEVMPQVQEMSREFQRLEIEK